MKNLVLSLLCFLPAPLWAFNLAPEVTVSGISSGGFMAAQMHVAFSRTIQGAAIIAAGPYGCAQGNAFRALNNCMQGRPVLPNGNVLRHQAQLLAHAGLIDDLENLRDDRVFLFSGTRDETVRSEVVAANIDFYQLPESSVRFVSDLPVGHAFSTLDFGNACELPNGTPWLSACDYDLAGELLTHLLGPMQAAHESEDENYFRFVQPAHSSLDYYGHAYVPGPCRRGERCQLHMALHGCEQGAEKIGQVFVRESGYNSWAHSNRVVIIYPQVRGHILKNPHGCWDWWGYTSNYYATKRGAQMNALKNMIDGFLNSTVDLLSY